MGWKNGGAQPIHSTGERMIAFWCQATGKVREDLPTQRISFSAAKIGR
ncbi:hypothetical protein JK151_19900 (plasmid) [Ralstonia syzygii subsp. celebesensis]|nr:hypothetical protein [Ralstonia syzygii]QQV57713.1 hypothetical protein JK151_19900 [Ralstonia syzygii subsp. celebesensis]